jgi:hypothetical protein
VFVCVVGFHTWCEQLVDKCTSWHVKSVNCESVLDEMKRRRTI